MEPHATIAAWDGDELTVWTATQGISGAQRTLAGLFGIPQANVRVICPFVGGGFGCKGNTWPPATLAAMASKIVNRPVKLVLSRAQMFTSNGYRPRTVQTIEGRRQGRRQHRLAAADGTRRCRSPSWASSSEPVALPDRDAVRLPERGDLAPAGCGEPGAADLHARARRGVRGCTPSNPRWTSWRMR